eukprot:366008-Chlamydomonas_euryale.AAC.15
MPDAFRPPPAPPARRATLFPLRSSQRALMRLWQTACSGGCAHTRRVRAPRLPKRLPSCERANWSGRRRCRSWRGGTGLRSSTARVCLTARLVRLSI